MQPRHFHSTILLMTCLTGCALLPTEPTTRHVLFVGNSYTFQHDVPALFRDASGSDIRYETEMVAGPGLNLMAYVAYDRVEQLVATKDWYAIVLQDRSTAAFYEKDRSEFKLALEWFRAIADEEGAQLFLFQTWPRRAGHSFYEAKAEPGFSPPRTPSEMSDRLIATYAEGAALSGAIVAPVGDCWFQQEDVEILYAEDGSHASAIGARLAARVIANTIAGTDDPCA
ncbi:MAG: hypothetical protein AAFY34_14965 [Pseudomonadota bacterium]